MPSSLLYRRALLAFLPVLLSISASAQNWAVAVRLLADGIASHAQSRSAMNISVRNVSSMTANDVAQVRRALETELHTRGVQFVGAERAVDEVRLTFSDNSNGHLWVAEVGHGDTWEVIMTQADAPDRTSSVAGVSIRKRLVWTQAQPVLDVAAADLAGTPALLVLQADSMTLYRTVNGQWVRDGAIAITRSQPFPRDARGRLMMQRDGSFTALLPGVQCQGATQPHLAASCEEKDDAWPLGLGSSGLRAVFNPSRNYFTGLLVPGLGVLTKLPPFYSAASVKDGGSTLWLFTLLDGSTRLVSAAGENLGFIGGSGSELAAVRNDCGDDLLLTTRGGDRTRPDAIQAYQITNGEPVEAGPSAEFSGPLLSLWTTPESNTVTAVSRNLKTNQYEAFTLTVACGH